jgi:hypothetical protein
LETFIKVQNEYEYYFDGTLSAEWYVKEKYPVVITPNSKDPRKVTIKWDSLFTG